MPAMTQAERRSIEKWMDDQTPDPVCGRCGDEACLIAACADPLVLYCRCGKPRLSNRVKCKECEAARVASRETPTERPTAAEA